jgi:hypothetical protein
VTVQAGDLLRLLGLGAARPASSAAPARADEPDFASLLSLAEKGEVSSGLPVTEAPGTDLRLSDDQLRRLADAVDRAEAQGVSRALVLIDGMALKVDVAVRRVTGRVDLAQGGVLTGIDAVVTAQAAPGSSDAAGVPLPPPRSDATGLNPSLLRALTPERPGAPSAARAS